VIDEFEEVARVEDLPAGSLRTVHTRRGKRVCLVHREGEILAVSAVCSHRHFPLAEGTILPGDRLECAWHGAQFDLRTGAALHAPAVDPIAVFEVEVRDGIVFVRDRRS
jgi:nitrite reductase/ring-hydroxylating ferredoxin subunit